MTPEFHRLASVELADAAAFYEASSPGLGHTFVDAMEALVARVCVHPEIGRERVGEIRIVSARRFPYVLVYEIVGDVIFILAVAHHRRLPKYWSDRRA